MHFTTDFSPFNIVYGFNHLTPINLIYLHVDEMFCLDRNKKAQVAKDLHVKV